MVIDITWALTGKLMTEAKRLGMTAQQATGMARWFGRLTDEERAALVHFGRTQQNEEHRRGKP